MLDVRPTPISGHQVQFWRNAHWYTMVDDFEHPRKAEISAQIERIFDLLEAQYGRQRDIETGRPHA